VLNVSGQVSNEPVVTPVTPQEMYANELEILGDEIALSFRFLRETVGVRGEAMGGAFAAIADDGSAINANNAGIAQIRQPHLLAFNPMNFHLNRTSFLGYVHPVGDISSLGSSVTLIRTPKYGEESTLVTLTYSWALETETDAYLGVGVKGFSRQSDAFDTNGVAFDFGLLVKLIDGNLSFGIAVQNVGPKMKLKLNDMQKLLERAGLESGQLPVFLAIPSKIDLPYNVKFGTAYKTQSRNFPLLLTGELDIPSIGFMRLSLGGEVWLLNIFAIRFGYNSQSDRQPGFTAGLGVRIDRLQFGLGRRSRRLLNAKIKGLQLGYSYLINEGVQNRHRVYLSMDF